MNAERLLEVYEKISEAPDAITRLRRFVLDLAVRGKLVEQSPADEPASRLLNRIEERKAEILLETGMRKPRKVADMDPAETWADLPSNWAWTQISNLGFISPRNDADDGVEASFVPMPMIFAEYGVANDHETRPWGEIKKGYTHFAEGDVGLAKITPCFENGKSTVFRNLTGDFGSGTTELHILRPVLVDPDYVVLFLKSPQFIETGIPKMTGTAGQKRVSSEYFTSSPFPLPPLTEQRRIVAKVDELMALCDRLEEARKTREETRDKLTAASLARLTAPDTTPEDFPAHAAFALEALPALTTRPDQIKTLRRTILNLAVRGQLVEQNAADEPASALLKRIVAEREKLLRAKEIRRQKPVPPVEITEAPFSIPDGWEWCRLGSLVLDSDAGWSPRTENHARVGDAWGVLKVSAVSWDQFDPDANKQVLPGTQPRLQAQVRKGDFLISRANTAELVARAVLVLEEPPRLMMSDKIVRLRLATECVHRFAWLINNYSDYGRDYYAANATGVSPSMKNVSRAVILNLPTPLPPLVEQHRIVAKVDALMALCDRLEAALTTTDDTRARLLEALLHEALETASVTLEAAE
ncbi:restriction endonuclease subunit S [Nioella nitratireducens]|uniref:restriction endonuclease subunit S n=1 Tax=Nioella nitratireducens TaxID=1287720 RepID=UPI0008FD84F5|nr:restriction endonuclease subunit S [Nioella nitratireducens]